MLHVGPIDIFLVPDGSSSTSVTNAVVYATLYGMVHLK